MFDDESPDDETDMYKTKKSKLPRRKNWQGREDADMLQEKQSGWRPTVQTVLTIRTVRMMIRKQPEACLSVIST